MGTWHTVGAEPQPFSARAGGGGGAGKEGHQSGRTTTQFLSSKEVLHDLSRPCLTHHRKKKKEQPPLQKTRILVILCPAQAELDLLANY